MRILLLLLAAVYSAQAAEWTYEGDHGPAHWGDDYPQCNGQAQSPVYLNSDTAKEVMLPNFEFTGYGKLDLVLANNGHSAVASVSPGLARMTGGDLNGTFELAQFHFHWGTSGREDIGSEHTMNDGSGERAYPLEVHFVHWNTKYGDIGNAVEKSDGLAVLGYFFIIDDAEGRKNPLEPLFKELDKIETKDDANVATFQDSKMVADAIVGKHGDFFRYKGSLTTPGCFETVKWTVFTDVMYITQESINGFYKLMDTEGAPIKDNFRPVQPLNGREVHLTKNHHNSGPGLSASLSLLLGLALAALWL